MSFKGMRIDRASPVPLYYQLAEAMRERIVRGDLLPGDQLPAERLLAEGVGISRMTARQAVSYLVSLGVLDVRHGVGTFVAEPKLTHDPSHLRGFSEDMLERGGTVTSRVLEQQIVTPGAADAKMLAIDMGEPVLRIVRVRSVNGVALVLETSVVRQNQCAVLVHANLEEESLYRLLADVCDVHVHHASQTIEARVANAYEADVLGIAEGQPMLVLEGVAFAENNDPVESFRAVYRGDRFRFELGSRNDGVPKDAVRGVPFGLVMTE